MNLLTLLEIERIQTYANTMLDLRQENCINIGVNPTDILNLSPVHGLILIKGNAETGFDHIHQRHELYSGKTYWNEQEGVTSLAYPSKFSPKSIPIMDYVQLADALYDPKLYNTKSNKSPSIFDLFEGIPSIDVAEGRKYRMLLYKNSRIIHTLYPTNNKYTRKKPAGFIFHKGPVIMEQTLISGEVKVSIPYFDKQKIKRYTAIIEYKPAIITMGLKIIIHRIDKKDLICTFEAEHFDGLLPDIGFLALQYQLTELAHIERLIGEIEKDKQTWRGLP